MTNATTEKTSKQVAINDIGSADDFLAAVEETLKGKDFNDGSLIEGTVVKIDRDEVLLDVGYKTEGVIPSRELSIKHDINPDEVVQVGDAVEALVLQKEDKEGRLILSKKRAQYERAWGDVERIKENDGVVTGTVIEVVKGGLIVDIGLRGFLPASLIELRRVRDLTPYLGQEIEAKILELDKNRNNVVLSRRALLEETQSASRSSFLAELKPGQVRMGVISSLVNFDAFVALGGVSGLVRVQVLRLRFRVVRVDDRVRMSVLGVHVRGGGRGRAGAGQGARGERGAPKAPVDRVQLGRRRRNGAGRGAQSERDAPMARLEPERGGQRGREGAGRRAQGEHGAPRARLS